MYILLASVINVICIQFTYETPTNAALVVSKHAPTIVRKENEATAIFQRWSWQELEDNEIIVGFKNKKSEAVNIKCQSNTNGLLEHKIPRKNNFLVGFHCPDTTEIWCTVNPGTSKSYLLGICHIENIPAFDQFDELKPQDPKIFPLVQRIFVTNTEEALDLKCGCGDKESDSESTNVQKGSSYEFNVRANTEECTCKVTEKGGRETIFTVYGGDVGKHSNIFTLKKDAIYMTKDGKEVKKYFYGSHR